MKKIIAIMILIIVLVGCQNMEVTENALNTKVEDGEEKDNCIDEKQYTWVEDDLTITMSKDEIKECDSLTVSLIESYEDNEYFVFYKVLFTETDIEEYDWITHSIIFTDEFIEKQQKEEHISQENNSTEVCNMLGTYENDQFVMTVDGETIYKGYFGDLESSSDLTEGVVIGDTKDGICITFSGIENDPREDDRIKKVLEKLNIIG